MSDYYERYWSAAGYDPTGDLPAATRRLLDEIARPGVRVVDVGCGDGGAVGAWALQRQQPYIGFDISATALERATGRGLQVARINEASDLPLPDAAEELVTCIEVFEHLVDPLGAAKEMHRLLAPGGQLVASVPNAAYWIRRVELALMGRFNPYGDDRSVREPWRDPHIRFFTRGTLTDMLIEAGFSVVQVRGITHPPFSLRARVEGKVPMSWLVSWLPAVFAPRLLATACR